MTTLEQTTESMDEIAERAARVSGQPVSIFQEFLGVANEAHRAASDEQRSLMRQLAHTMPTPEQATTGIRQIMGWEAG